MTPEQQALIDLWVKVENLSQAIFGLYYDFPDTTMRGRLNVAWEILSDYAESLFWESEKTGLDVEEIKSHNPRYQVKKAGEK